MASESTPGSTSNTPTKSPRTNRNRIIKSLTLSTSDVALEAGHLLKMAVITERDQLANNNKVGKQQLKDKQLKQQQHEKQKEDKQQQDKQQDKQQPEQKPTSMIPTIVVDESEGSQQTEIDSTDQIIDGTIQVSR